MGTLYPIAGPTLIIKSVSQWVQFGMYIFIFI